MVQVGKPIDSDVFAVVATAVAMTQTPGINHNCLPTRCCLRGPLVHTVSSIPAQPVNLSV